jgi:oxygen-independent coproporphyrinogen III oxidase
METYSLYIHIPFCRSRCGYCDFNTYAGMEQYIDAYVEALCKEIEKVSKSTSATIPVHTIYFGGGTPSLIPEFQLSKILDLIHKNFQLSDDLEASLEANPGTVNLPYLKDLRSMGFNRISLGMQSAIPEELRLLERRHNTIDVISAVKWARQAGFTNINLDLIFGLPNQSMRAWQHSVDFALQINPEHLSLYALTVEPGTPLHRWVNCGLVDGPDADLAADMYEWASDRLDGAGYGQYEISNWAKRREHGLISCRHNLQYWRNQPYLGFGAGAHGYASKLRVANISPIVEYIKRCLTEETTEFPRSPATLTEEFIDQKNEIAETMMMGLRLTSEGVSAEKFEKRFGKTLMDIYPKEIDELVGWGLLEWVGASEAIRITSKGRILGNQVFIRFI